MFGQLTPEQQMMANIVAQETTPSILSTISSNPIYLVGGGLLILWLLKKRGITIEKGKVKHRRKFRR
jgi:hypothetical protein